MINFRSDIGIKKSKRRIVYMSISISFTILIIILVAILLLKYNVEGEKNLPFEITNILIVSTVDAIGNDDSENRWNLSILQNNDIYIDIKEKSGVEKKDSFKKITLQNFNLISTPQKGEPKIYHPIDDKDLIYLYKDENLIEDKIEYKASSNSNLKKLEIARNGGIVSFSSCSNNIATYISNEDTEIRYDGSILNKVNINEEELKYEISFDIIVEMESNKKYQARIDLKLPLDNLITEGTVKKEIKDFDNIVFKRI